MAVDDKLLHCSILACERSDHRSFGSLRALGRPCLSNTHTLVLHDYNITAVGAEESSVLGILISFKHSPVSAGPRTRLEIRRNRLVTTHSLDTAPRHQNQATKLLPQRASLCLIGAIALPAASDELTRISILLSRQVSRPLLSLRAESHEGYTRTSAKQWPCARRKPQHHGTEYIS